MSHPSSIAVIVKERTGERLERLRAERRAAILRRRRARRLATARRMGIRLLAVMLSIPLALYLSRALMP